jgi:hypothetical protein
VRHGVRKGVADKPVNAKDEGKAAAASGEPPRPRQRGFINFSAAKERQKSQFAAGRAR